MSNDAVSVVVPCYRDGESMAGLVAALTPVIASLPDGSELVLVDDGSPDATFVRACEETASTPFPTRVVRLARNFGQHAAVIAGLEHARCPRVVIMDSDLQYPPEEIPRLVDELGDGVHVAAGYREDRRDPPLRRLASRLLNRWISRRTGVQIRDVGCMFRAYDRVAVDLLLSMPERHKFLPALVAWLGLETVDVPITHAARSEQGSRYRWGPLLDLFFDIVTGYSTSPTRRLAVLGTLLAMVSFSATAVLLVYRLVVGAGVSGTITVFAVVFLLLGTQLLLTAVLAEYIGRIYAEAQQRPIHVVGTVVDRDGVVA